MDPQRLPLTSIRPGMNDRTTFDPGDLAALAKSMAESGLLQPILVRPIAGGYEIVAGERRYRAAQLLEWVDIPVLVREMTDDEASAAMLTENTGRKNLNPIEEARAYQRRLARGWSMARIAEVSGVSGGTIADRLHLLDLVPEVQDLVAKGQFPLGHGVALSVLNPNYQRVALRAFTSRPMTLDQFRVIISDLAEKQNQLTLFDDDLLLSMVPMPAPRTKPQVPVEVSNRLPAINYVPNRVRGIMELYIGDLSAAGLMREAEAVQHLLAGLARSNFVR